jgi:ABC-type Mn2+/Zn2+ transport system ATPase subunit
MRAADATRGGWSGGGGWASSPAPELRGQGISVRAGQVALLRDVDVSIRPGRITAVVGRNGAGKSTLLRALAGEAPLHRGEVVLEGRPLGSWPLCDVARRRAVLPQRSTLTFAFPVEEVVGLGRMPHARASSADRDRRVVEAALRRTGANGSASTWPGSWRRSGSRPPREAVTFSSTSPSPPRTWAASTG